LCNININFKSDNKKDPKLKILIFIISFINHYIGSRDINTTIKSISQYKIIETYVEMLNSNVKHTDEDTLLEKLTNINNTTKHEILSAAYFSNTFALLIEKYMNENNIVFPTHHINKLFNYFIKLIFINYHSEQLHASTKYNLENNYNEKIEFALVQCEYINEIQELLKIICPHNMNMLVVLINQLLKPLYA
jgi:hypothetical protein